MFVRLILCLSLLVMSLPSTPAAAQSSTFNLEQLPPCNFNAYSERDDILMGGIALNLRNGQGCMQNLNSTFPFASVGKIFILAALYDRIYRGLDYATRELQFTSDYLMNGRDDCLNESQIDLYFQVQYLAEVMIWCSDNVATWMLMDYLGWDYVNGFIQSLGIEGIGQVIPYSEVDRIKLSLLDDRWRTVPSHLASQFYRRQITDELVPTYFASPPFYPQEDLRVANYQYVTQYQYNTATPRALMEYMLRLREQVRNAPDSVEGLVARRVFSVMLLTQRQFTTQAYPGTTYVGSKNGFDYGLRAEVNFTVGTLLTDRHIPDTISVVMARVRDIRDESYPYRLRSSPIEQTLRQVSLALARLLYPDAKYDAPQVVSRPNVNMVVLSEDVNLEPCWELFPTYTSLNTLEDCWRNAPRVFRLNGERRLGVGVVVRGLNGQDAHLTLLYTLPDGSLRSYQLQYVNTEVAAFAWFEEVTNPGLWRLDVYYELAPVFTQNFIVDEQAQ